MRHRFWVWVAVWLTLLVIIALAARAHAPEDTDPAMAPWFRSLAQPDSIAGSCCNESDCHVLGPHDMEIRADGSYWIKDPDVESGAEAWLQVPPERVLARYDNPTGKYVACVFYHRVLCFVKAAGI